MKFQILVPQYKEIDEEIKPLLDSIAIQQNEEAEIGIDGDGYLRAQTALDIIFGDTQ